MNWFFFAILSVISLSFSSIFQRILMKEEKSDSLSYSVTFQFICTIIVGVYALIEGFVLPPIAQQPFFYLLGGVLYGGGTLFLFKALQKLGSGEVTIFTSVRAVVTIIIAIVILNEPFNLLKLIGTIMVLSAVLLTSRKQGEKFKLNEGVVYSLAMALVYGAAFVNDKFLLRSAEPISYTAVMFFLPGLALLAYRPAVVKKFKDFVEPKLLKRMLVMSILYSLAAIAFFTALSTGANASQMSPINQASVVLTVLLAAFFLKETERLPIKIFSAFLVIIGVLLLR